MKLWVVEKEGMEGGRERSKPGVKNCLANPKNLQKLSMNWQFCRFGYLKIFKVPTQNDLSIFQKIFLKQNQI